jgi:hypothetical protein
MVKKGLASKKSFASSSLIVVMKSSDGNSKNLSSAESQPQKRETEKGEGGRRREKEGEGGRRKKKERDVSIQAKRRSSNKERP